MLCFLRQRDEVFDSVQALEVSAGGFGSPKPLLCFPSAERQEEQGKLVNVFELMWFVSSYHHGRAEVLCPVTCLTAWWRSLWSAQVSYTKLLLECGLGGTPGTASSEQRQPVHQPCPLPGGGLHHHSSHLPGLLPACATTPDWRGTRAPVQAPESSHKRGMKPPVLSGSLKQGQLSSQPVHAASVDLFTA